LGSFAAIETVEQLKKKDRLPLLFSKTLFAVMALVFLLHYFILKSFGAAPFNDLMAPAYVINFLLAVGIFIGLYSARKKLKNALGFLFMGGSLVKFAIFFIIFYPVYRADGEIQKMEFAAFFIPYLTSLILETYFASKMLNQASES
jgi:hypothetical protein